MRKSWWTFFKEDVLHGWLPLGLLVVCAPLLLVPAFTSEDDTPPPSDSPGHVGRWEYGNEAPDDAPDIGDVGIEPDCDASGCYP